MLTASSSSDDEEPLLGGASASQPVLEQAVNGEDERTGAEESANQNSIARRLYLSHFLSTWNSRVFEFGATLYLATIFPHTLLPLSVYALVRGLSAIILSPSVGQYIDKADRLNCVRVSIGTSLRRRSQRGPCANNSPASCSTYRGGCFMHYILDPRPRTCLG